MTIYEYFRFKSAADIQEDLRQSGKWKNWKSFPEYREDFLEFFNLEDDDRIKDYNLYQGSSSADLTIDFSIPTGLEIGNIRFRISYCISGYKLPIVEVVSSISGFTEFDFGGKYTVNANNRNVSLYIRPGKICRIMTNCMAPDCCISDIEGMTDIMNETTKKVYTAICDGTYEKTCNAAGIEYNPKKLVQSRYPNFQDITFLIMKTKIMLSCDLPVDDAIMLNVFTEKTLNTLHTHKNKELEKHMKMMRFVWDWQQFADVDEDNMVPKDIDELHEIINEAKFQIIDGSTELIEYREAVVNASRYVSANLDRLLVEAAECYGINKKYINVCRSTYSSIEDQLKNISGNINEYPDDWRLK